MNNFLINTGGIIFNSGYYNMKFVYVQSILPKEDVIALKKKSKKSSVEKAIAKAVYYYLKCENKE